MCQAGFSLIPFSVAQSQTLDHHLEICKFVGTKIGRHSNLLRPLGSKQYLILQLKGKEGNLGENSRPENRIPVATTELSLRPNRL